MYTTNTILLIEYKKKNFIKIHDIFLIVFVPNVWPYVFLPAVNVREKFFGNINTDLSFLKINIFILSCV